MSEYIYTTEGAFGLRECTGEEIVRCKDCEWLTKDEDGDEWCRYLKRHVAKDDFCAWGERRELEAVEVWNQWSADDVTCSEES